MTTPNALIAKLIQVGTGQIAHVYNGCCPDKLEGPDLRDNDCPACQVLAEADRYLSGQPAPDSITKDGIAVAIGQVWSDMDSRMGNRHGKVKQVLAGKVRMQPCLADGHELSGSLIRISVKRMHRCSDGWTLLSPKPADGQSLA